MVGDGLDDAEKYRNLSHIAVLDGNEAIRHHHRDRRPCARYRVDAGLELAPGGRYAARPRDADGTASDGRGNRGDSLEPPADLVPVADVRRVVIGSDRQRRCARSAPSSQLRGRRLGGPRRRHGRNRSRMSNIAAVVPFRQRREGSRRRHRHRRRGHPGRDRRADSRHRAACASTRDDRAVFQNITALMFWHSARPWRPARRPPSGSSKRWSAMLDVRRATSGAWNCWLEECR